jgi:hypothetical protein
VSERQRQLDELCPNRKCFKCGEVKVKSKQLRVVSRFDVSSEEVKAKALRGKVVLCIRCHMKETQ